MILLSVETADVQAVVATIDVHVESAHTDVSVSTAKRADLEISARLDAV